MPGSKSYTNRALLLAALGKGKSILRGCLESDDTGVMKNALKALGVKILEKKDRWEIFGRNGKFEKPLKPLFIGNAGTAMRFLAAASATQSFETVLTGDLRMQKRPIKDLVDALRQFGVSVIYLKKNGFPPIKIHGPMRGGSCELSGKVSSQFLSGLIMASPLALKPVHIRLTSKLVSRPYVEMTRHIMKNFRRDYLIEGDASSASYFWGLAALSGTTVGINNIPADSRQADMRFLAVLRKMGCRIVKNGRGIWVHGPGQLKAPGKISLRDMPDSAMTAAVLCAGAKGVSELHGLANLRVKESNRLKAMKTELAKIGIRVIKLKDGWKIFGNPEAMKRIRKPVVISTYNDHRMAMCFGMLQVKLPHLVIKNAECVKKTYPFFWRDLRKTKEQIFHGKNFVLTGMRGSGKSTLGKLLAESMQKKFVDLDNLIQQAEKMSISEMVEKHGWVYFRKKEQALVKKITKQKNLVIAAGGGVIIKKDNVETFKKNGLIIFLEASLATLEKRLKHDYHRPSLTGQNSLRELSDVLKKRIARYRSTADWILPVKDADARRNIKPLIKLLAI